MEVVTLDQVGTEAWDEFCGQSNDAWFWHTTAWMTYLRAYKPELETRGRPLVARQGDRIVGIVPAMVERSADEVGRLEFGSGGGPCWGPAFANDLDEEARTAAFRLLLDEMDHVADELGATRGWLRLSPLSPAFEKQLAFWLTEFTRAGWPDVSLTSVVVDLSVGNETLWRAIRKGHRADVRRAQKCLTVRIDDRHSRAAGFFETYRRLHHKAAGRLTRPEETFRLMEAWIAEGRAVLATAFLEGVAVGCSYVYLYKTGAYYGSSAGDPDAPHLPLGHLLQWEVMQWLASRGVAHYEIGLQQFGVLPYDFPSSKEQSISHFKRGFGGRIVPLVTRERFFSPAAGAKEFHRRADRLAESDPSPHVGPTTTLVGRPIS